MRIVFCASGSFAVPCLRGVQESAHEVVGVFTQPARPAGRGAHLQPTPAAEAARSANLAVAECPKINDPQVVQRLRELCPDVICVADFGQMVRRDVRACARLDTINVHASLLPALRGAAPINWAILRGLPRTGVTIISLTDEMDAGDIYLQQATDIGPAETAEELRARLANLGAALLCQTLDALAAGTAVRRPQDHSQATRAPILQKTDGILDWSQDAQTLRDRIHGTWPWPGGQACFRGRSKQVDVVIARAEAQADAPAGSPGRIDAERRVETGGGRLRIRQVRPAGKRLMDWKDFVNGYRVANGDRFCMPGEAKP